MTRIRWNKELVAAEMLKEDCILKSNYKDTATRLTYEYHGEEYSVRWNDWLSKTRPSRPHLTGGNRRTKAHERWTNEKVNELLNMDDCELADEYTSTKQRFRYRYNGSYYWTTLDDWIHHQSRPHLYENGLETLFRTYLEENNIEFVTQKTYDDLKSSKDYKLRFDFYLPSYNMLVEMDERGHVSMKDQVEHGRLKDEYCVRNNIKLLRIDETNTVDDFHRALTTALDSNLYIIKYGRLYNNYNGMYK